MPSRSEPKVCQATSVTSGVPRSLRPAISNAANRTLPVSANNAGGEKLAPDGASASVTPRKPRPAATQRAVERQAKPSPLAPENKSRPDDPV